MAASQGLPLLTVEIATKSAPLYLANQNYITAAADSPAETHFEPRLVDDVRFSRGIGLSFHGSKPRGSQNFDAIDINNQDGALDSHVGSSLRDQEVVIKRGSDVTLAYSALDVVQVLTVDRIEFVGTERVRVYTKGIGAKLDRALQLNTYPATTINASLRGRPRPIVIGRAYNAPCLQVTPYANGQFDVHEDDNWIGIEQLCDQGATLIEGTAYERSTKTGVYGFERLSTIGGKHAATVLGAFKITTTWIDEAFANLSAWTENNGGVGGRDASIVSNQLSMVNTAGGADLSIDFGTSITATRDKYFFYQIDCAAWTSGSCQIRSSSVIAVVEKTIDAVGRYTGIIRAGSNFTFRISAPNGSNCSLVLDSLKLYEVTPIESLTDWLTYLCVTKGPLSSGDLDASSISTLEAATGYKYGASFVAPVTIADVLDGLATSYGGAWWIGRTGTLKVGQLLAPTGTAAYSFDQSSIMDGMEIEFDEARGMSNRILSKKNWDAYTEGEVVAALNNVRLNSADKDADVTLSVSDYTYSAANVGSVRSVPALAGGRIYFEVRASTVDGTQQHYIGYGNASATITSYPGATNDSTAYRANGQSYTNASGAAYGNTWAANDVIGVAVDMRAAAMGSRQQHHRIYWSKNGTWQNSGNPDTETAPVIGAINVTGFAYAMLGGNVASTNAGAVNFGGEAFAYTPPADYLAPAWHRTAVASAFRHVYQSATALADEYAAQVAARGATDDEQGVATLLTRATDAVTECDRWAALFASERFLYRFTVLLAADVDADVLEPFDLIEVTYPRFGLSAKKLRVLDVSGSLLSRAVTVLAWG